MPSRSTTFALFFFALVACASSQTVAAQKTNDTVIIAKSSAADPAARQIVRTVANESLKTISTKDTASTDNGAIAPLEDHGPVVLPSKVESESAPGTREPAAAAEKSDHDGHSGHAHAATPAKESSPPAAPGHGHAATAKVVSADKSLLWLQNGNKRFLKKANRSDGKSQIDRDRLSKGQHPHAIVLSCSDSRVPPETVFDQALGEIFVIRTAGEVIDSAVLASIEYAVEHLHPQLLVVMGHTSCGAVAATISTKEGDTAGSPSLDALIADIRPRLPARGPAGASSKNLEIESSANAQGVAADLVKRSPIIRAHVEKGDLTIKPAIYHLDSGNVKFY